MTAALRSYDEALLRRTFGVAKRALRLRNEAPVLALHAGLRATR